MANAPKKFDYKSAIANLSKNRDVQRLQLQLAKQKAGLAEQGVAVPKTHPSVLSRIFDVVSRPNYAVANTYKAVVDKINENKAAGKGGDITQLPGILAGGALRGIEGKDKTRFSDVLQAGGVKNKYVRAFGGLGADIATDPLNAVGFGVTKAIPDIERTAEAGKAIRASMALKKATPESLVAAGELSGEAAKAAAPGKISLELFGKPVAESTKAYEAAAKVLRPIAATGPARTANELFRTAAAYPGRLKEMMRVPQQRGISGFVDFSRDALKQFHTLTPEEGARAAHAIEQGVDLSGVVSKSGKVDLGDFQKFYLDHKQAWESVESGLGVKRVGQGVDTHIPKFLPKGEYDSEAAQRLRSIESKVSKSLAAGKDASYPTLADYKDAGLHPHENLLDSMRVRAAQYQRTVGLETFVRDASSQFGTEIAGKGTKAARSAMEQSGLVRLSEKDFPHLAGKEVWAPPEVQRAVRTLKTFYTSDEATNKFLKTFDGIQRLWKTGVTTINPSHWTRNLVGDSFLNWEAGVQSPLDYQRALRVMREQGAIKVGSKSFSTSEILNLYHDTGAASGFMNVDLIGAVTPGAKMGAVTQPINSTMEGLRRLTAKREDFMRLANFTHALRQYGEEHGVESFADLRKAAVEYATPRVKKFNFDYGDLTHFESAGLRRLVPFYTFMRKNLPLQLEMLALHPGRITKIPQSFNAMQQLLGTDSGHMPMTEVLPAYLKDLANVRLRGESKGHNAIYGDIPLPIEDLSRQFSGSTSDVIRKMLGQTSPFLRIPTEVGTKQSLLSGQPIGPLPKYLSGQLGLTRTAQQFAAPTTPNRVIKPGEKFGNRGLEAINFLTGAGLKEITPQVQKSELKRQQDPVQARLRNERIKRINARLRAGGR